MALYPEGQGQGRGQRETARLGLPDGFKPYSPFPFAGVNQQASRVAMADQEFYWRENFIKVGPGYLRSMYDVGPSVWSITDGRTIRSFFWFGLGINTRLCAIFLSDGAAVQLNLDTGVVVTMAGAGTFAENGGGGSNPACAQWGTQYLLIANNHTANAYFIWDGTLLYRSGSLSPNITITDAGSGYTSAPTVTAYGGSGSGATFHASVANGMVVEVVETSAGSGYVAGDLVQLGFSGGGSDTTPILTAVMSTGGLANVIITAPGTGYTAGVYALGIAGTGSGAAGTYTVLTTGGGVNSVSITASGSGYTATPTITFPSGGGSGTTSTAILTTGQIVASITVTVAGTGLTGTPLISFEGNAGSGATAVAHVSGGAITSVDVTNGGTGYDGPPLVILSSSNNAAQGTVEIMPTGISGNIIETFQSRVWLGVPFQSGTISNGGTFLVTAPNSYTDFATSDGGLIFTSTDPFLRTRYVNLKQTNGYLYPIGDSSVSIVSNVQTTGTPPTTTFNYQNTDPQIGAQWRDSVQPFGRSLIFANHNGIFALYGGAVQKVSDKIDHLFDVADFTTAGISPTAAVCYVRETKLYLLNMTLTDPRTQARRTLMVAWDGREWSIASQTSTFTYIGTLETNSDITAYGTDGTKLLPLFAVPSASLTKTWSTKLYGAQDLFITKMSYGFYLQLTDYSTAATGVTVTVTVDNGVHSYPLPVGTRTISAPYPELATFACRSGDIPGEVVGCTFTSTSADFVVTQAVLGYYDQAALA